MSAPATKSWPLPNPSQQKKVPQSQGFDGFIDKRPYKLRVNPFIEPTHKDFLDMEAYFTSLLRSTSLTIEDILETHFEDHEIAIFTPATKPEQLVNWQKDNALRYQALLKTLFKGHLPSLQFKMTLLWFGLPVEPMRPGATEMPDPYELDVDDNSFLIDTDPLEFLDDCTSRTYGRPKLGLRGGGFSVAVKPPPPIFTPQKPQKPVFTQPKDMEPDSPLSPIMEEDSPPSPIMEEDSPSSPIFEPILPPLMKPQKPKQAMAEDALWPPNQKTKEQSPPSSSSEEEEEPQLHNGVWLYGFQGCRFARSLTYSEFVRLTDLLLGQVNNYDYEVHVTVFNESDFTKILDQEDGWIRHDAPGHKVDVTGDRINDMLSRWFEPGSAGNACFVRYIHDDVPHIFAPPRDNVNIVRFWDSTIRGVSYMRVPADLEVSNFQSNQYHQEYLRAIKALHPTQPHVYFNPGMDDELFYGWLDPSASTWRMIANRQSLYKETVSIAMQPTRIPIDFVTVLVPGFHNYTTSPPPITASPGSAKYPLYKKELKISGKEEDKDGLLKVLRDVSDSNSAIESYRPYMAVDIWFPGENFLKPGRRPRRIPANDPLTAAQALVEWRTLVRSWPGEQAHLERGPVSMVARPVFSEYRVRAESSDALFNMDIDVTTLDEFKTLVQEKLFLNYDPADKTQVLHLTQTTWEDDKPEFAIRHESTDADWDWVLKNITEPDITVSVQTWNNAWNFAWVPEWGPRYDELDLTTLTRFEKVKPQINSKFMDEFFKNSDNTQTSAQRSATLRERFFWQAPSIFTNPTKPAMPIHGAPLESIIRTGPNMPGISIGMMTPTEMARLQLEVHSLRNQLLDRTRECPYLDCKRYFRFDDGEGLDAHLKKDHGTLQCFLCKDNATVLRFYDSDQIRKHFLDKHYDEFKTMFGYYSAEPVHTVPKYTVSDPVLGAVPNYCDRCGRDQKLLDNFADRTHHAKVCKKLGDGKYPTLNRTCRDCGRKMVRVLDEWGPVPDQFQPCLCGHGESNPSGSPERYCTWCGLRYDHNLDFAYRQIHSANCKPPKGHEWDYCPYCGIGLGGLPKEDRAAHGASCEAAPPPPTPSPPPTPTPTTSPTGPQSESDPGDPDIPEKCTLFYICGAVTKLMTAAQLADHMDWHLWAGHIVGSPAPPDPPAPGYYKTPPSDWNAMFASGKGTTQASSRSSSTSSISSLPSGSPYAGAFRAQAVGPPSPSLHPLPASSGGKRKRGADPELREAEEAEEADVQTSVPTAPPAKKPSGRRGRKPGGSRATTTTATKRAGRPVRATQAAQDAAAPGPEEAEEEREGDVSDSSSNKNNSPPETRARSRAKAEEEGVNRGGRGISDI